MALFGDIEESAHNVCGMLSKRYIILAPVDDYVDRRYLEYHVCEDPNAQTGVGTGDTPNPHAVYSLIVARHAETDTSVHKTIKVLKKVKDRSKHFPRLVLFGKFPRLIYGSDGDQEPEQDPEWGGRAFALMEYYGALLSNLFYLSPYRAVPVELALMIGIGCVRALAALHRAGYVHRLVSPFSFSVRLPYSIDNFLGKILITDLSFVLPFPCKPRKIAPFIGCRRYCSVRVHWGREQGPSDDIISVIYMVAEFIHGKLPWRSVVDDDKWLCELKMGFSSSAPFQKLPHEVRQVYRQMCTTLGPSLIDHKAILTQFQKALKRVDPESVFTLPDWLTPPLAVS